MPSPLPGKGVGCSGTDGPRPKLLTVLTDKRANMLVWNSGGCWVNTVIMARYVRSLVLVLLFKGPTYDFELESPGGSGSPLYSILLDIIHRANNRDEDNSERTNDTRATEWNADAKP
jgi:hypothetical protein